MCVCVCCACLHNQQVSYEVCMYVYTSWVCMHMSFCMDSRRHTYVCAFCTGMCARGTALWPPCIRCAPDLYTPKRNMHRISSRFTKQFVVLHKSKCGKQAHEGFDVCMLQIFGIRCVHQAWHFGTACVEMVDAGSACMSLIYIWAMGQKRTGQSAKNGQTEHHFLRAKHVVSP